MTRRLDRAGLNRISIVVLLALSAAPHRGRAQAPAQQASPRFQPEVRVDFIDARVAAAHLGLGVSVPASTYVRLGIVGAAGQSWRKGESSGAGRIDALMRFVVDPLRESRWAPYAAGGIGAIYDGPEKWRGVLVGVLGLEGPGAGHVVPAIEAGFGGGARFGIALRRAMRGRR